MLKYNFRLFLRNLRRQKLFSFINLMGLTVSMASTLLIYLYVSHEMSYDNFHPHIDRLYRVNQTFIWADNPESQFSRTGPGVAHALIEELTEIEITTSLHTPGNFIISYTNPKNEVFSFEEDEVFAADTNFFKVLSFPLIKGDESSAFRSANTLMMTESTAKKYFGDENAVGKMVRIGGPGGSMETFEVIGVIQDVPENSTIQFDVLLSMKNFPVERLHWSWIWTQLETFVRLHEGADINTVREKLAGIPRKRAEETLRAGMNMTYDEYIASGKKWELFLQPVTSLHLPDQPVVGSFSDTGNIKILYSLIGSAVFIVLLSCINFMNLSTAQFTRRIKEASVRKILGLGKKELATGYFTEALIFCSLAMFAALAVTQMLMPAFRTMTEKDLSFDLLQNPEVLTGCISLVLLMAVVSSSYPTLFLSKFNPVEAVKGKIRVGREGKAFRNGLVVFQFCVSIMLMICTAVVFQQLQYVSEKDHGFQIENLVEVKHVEAIKNPESFAKAVLNVPGVIESSWCNSTPPRIYGGDSFGAEGTGGRKFSLNYASGDENYINALGTKLKYGRNFSKENPGDKNRVLVNEATLRKLGWPTDESVLGNKITYPGSDSARFEIIGILPDFNYWTLESGIEPLAIFHIENKFLPKDPKSYLAVRVKPQNEEAWKATIIALQQVWKQHAGDTPFQYGFIDEYFAEAFKTQQRFGTVLVIMATLAILIASLGLLGMIIYALEQRTKEIGIRKVSGASAINIISLISRGYTKLIVIAFIIGAPVSYWMMNSWLEDFAYRITPSPWIFLASGLVTLLIAILITGYHSYKAALANPVDVLRDE
jgi:putative ABC transport system permease protein